MADTINDLALKFSLFMDNAGTASQNRTLVDDAETREAVELNVFAPMLVAVSQRDAEIERLQAQVAELTEALATADQQAAKLEALLDPHISYDGKIPAGCLATCDRIEREPVVTDDGSYTNLREANVARQAAWCPEQIPDLAFRGCELAGEVGEALNVIKKLERERLGWRGSRDTVEHLAEELADIIICTDLVAMSAGIDLDAAVVAKFNATSEKVGLPHRLSALASAPERVEAEPVAWVIPDIDNANDRGYIDAMAWQEGEFTRPLYASPPAPVVTEEMVQAALESLSKEVEMTVPLRSPMCRALEAALANREAKS